MLPRPLHKTLRPMWFLLLACCTPPGADAQTETFNRFTYAAPAGFTKNQDNQRVMFVKNDGTTYCHLALWIMTDSKGDNRADFDNDWQNLVARNVTVKGTPRLEQQVQDGWQVTIGAAEASFQNAPLVAVLVTCTKGRESFSLTSNFNDEAYMRHITEFLDKLDVTAGTPVAAGTQAGKQPAPKAPAAVKSGFQFTTSNFDDGWTATEQADWVLATKGGIRVLIHYPRAEDKEYISQQVDRTRTFWNLLVAPRYSHLRDFELLEYNNNFEPGYFAAGTLTENGTGKTVYVVLFQKAKSNWIEIIAPDKEAFVQQFGIRNPGRDFYGWEPLAALNGYNKFAVAAPDLAGTWTNRFASNQYYANVYTGLSAGMSTYQSRTNFVFTGNTYHWDLIMGHTGTVTTRDQAKASGTWRMAGNWQIYFSEIERKPKTYNAYFSCIKGNRILWLEDTGYATGYTAYGRVE